MSERAEGVKFGRASELYFRTADPKIQVIMYLDGHDDGFTLRLSGGSLTESFRFSHDDGTRLLDAISHAWMSLHLLEEYGLFMRVDPKFEVGMRGRPTDPFFHLMLRGERSLDLHFSFGKWEASDFCTRVRDVLEGQTIRGVMES